MSQSENYKNKAIYVENSWPGKYNVFDISKKENLSRLQAEI